MRITNFKLKKGLYPVITFHDGNVEVVKSYPSTDAPPLMLKAMRSFNNHVTEMTEQHSSDGNYDYDMVTARSYSIKGEGEKEGIVITGIRTLSSGKSIVLNTPFTNLDTVNSEYPKIGQLLTCMDNLRVQIENFMKSNPSQDDVQGKLQFNSPENTIIKAEPKDPNDVTDEWMAELAKREAAIKEGLSFKRNT